MGMRYTYDTRKIERDFVLKRVEGNCNKDTGITRTIGVMCKTCPFFLKIKTFYLPPKEEYKLNLETYGTFVFCKFHKKDDEGTKEVIRKMYEEFEQEAITHYYD